MRLVALVSMVLACSNPPVAAVLVEVPDIVVIDTELRQGMAVQVRIDNDTEAAVRFEAPACRLGFERLFFDTWAPVPGEGACTGDPVTLQAGASVAFVVTLPSAAGRYRMTLQGTQGTGSFVARSVAFEVGF